MTDFDSHRIGHQQPQAPAHQEIDTHLHHQPAPDVTSTQPTSTFAASTSPMQSPMAQHQPVTLPSHASPGAAEPTTAPTHQQQQQTGAPEAPSSSTQPTPNQTETAALPHSSSQKSAAPAHAEQTQQQPSTRQHHDASSQQPASSSDSVHPPPLTMPQQPQADQQPAVHARSETPSYTPSNVQHTGHTGVSQSEGKSSQTKQHQQESVPHSAASADATATGSGRADDASGRQVGQAGQTGAGNMQTPVASAAIPERQQGAAGSGAAAQNESQQGNVTAATASPSQQGSAAQQSDVCLAPTALPDQPPEVAATNSSAHAGQQGQEAERGAGFPAGPLGEAPCCCSMHTCIHASVLL